MSLPSSPSDRFHWPTFLKKLLLVVVAISIGIVIWYASQGLVLIFAGILFAIFLSSLAALCARKTGLSRQWGLAVVVLVLMIVSVGGFAVMGYQITQTVSELVQNLDQSLTNLRGQSRQVPLIRKTLEQLPSPGRWLADGMTQVSDLKALFLTPIGLVVNVLFICFTGLYFAVSADEYRDGLVRLFPENRRNRIREVLAELGDSLWHWVLARLFTMFVTGTLTGIALAILGVPLPITLGVLTGLLVFVPNIGAVLAVLPPMLLAWQQGPTLPWIVLAVYVGIQGVESYFLTPMVQQREVNLLPAFVLSAQLLAGLLIGPLGVAFATPIALCGVILVRELYIKDQLEQPVTQ